MAREAESQRRAERDAAREATALRMEAERQETEARERAEQEAEDAACRKDIQCLGDRSSISAAAFCRVHVERLSEYAHRWTDGFLESKFPAFQWKDKTNEVIRYHGDSIEFQNAFGAWLKHRYWCDHDTVNDRPLRVGAEPGRLLG